MDPGRDAVALRRERRETVNQSLSIGSIHADVVAVGSNAWARGRGVPLSERREELVSALGQLREALSRTGLDQGARDACDQCMRSIEAESRKPQPDRARIETSLGRLASHIMSAGVVLRETLALLQPIETIAGLVGTSLTLLRLW